MKKQIINIPTQRKIKVILTIEGGVKFVGVATCLPTDEFNQEFGEDLATRKAKVKLYTYLVRKAREEMKRQDELSDIALRNYFKSEEGFERLLGKLGASKWAVKELVNFD